MFIIDLIHFGHGSFDVIIEMDWLSNLTAKKVCFKKIVKILLFNGDILEVHGEHPGEKLKQLKTMNVNEPKLEDIHVVYEFPTVFSKDLSGLPPSRELKNSKKKVSYDLALHPGSTSVVRKEEGWFVLDYDCEIRYHPGKANVVADALSMKEWMKPRRARAISMKIHSNIKARILKAQSEASKDINTLAEMLRGLEKQFERKEDVQSSWQWLHFSSSCGNFLHWQWEVLLPVGTL
uniref:Reverse transcriptase domain-containing protein n=1 Tax=Tanacetum cinerariifolium TaxID=118510 RepID=A0A699HUC0_TANCI|nr:reverse transcriptase domain-containing protein [Tanacetum cinerariifolium]